MFLQRLVLLLLLVAACTAQQLRGSQRQVQALDEGAAQESADPAQEEKEGEKVDAAAVRAGPMSYGWYYSPGKDQAGAPAEAEAAAATEGKKADASAVRAGPVSYG
jgi:hypothetical protein